MPSSLGALASSPAERPLTPTEDARVAEASVPRQMKGLARRRGSGYFFVTVLVGSVGTFYALYVRFVLYTELRIPGFRRTLAIAVGALFHIATALFIISIIQAMFTEPGAVPPTWGFYVNEERKRKRYCRICNCWKPDRTHHCSQCQRCVLQMDHHCPWINNCVGFYNRKFFLQILFYANICLLLIAFHLGFHLLLTTAGFLPSSIDGYFPDSSYYHDFENDVTHWSCAIALLVLVCIFITSLIPFTRFHWQLLILNSTTIESIDQTIRELEYDIGTRRNIEQVFGPTPLLWFLPFHLKSSLPVGDGIRWRKQYLRSHHTSPGAYYQVPTRHGNYEAVPSS